jgi:hypothetical protein
MLIYNGFYRALISQGSACVVDSARRKNTDDFTYHFLDARFPLVVLALF